MAMTRGMRSRAMEREGLAAMTLRAWLAAQRTALASRVPRPAPEGGPGPRVGGLPAPALTRAMRLSLETASCHACGVAIVGAAVMQGDRVFCIVCGPAWSGAPAPVYGFWEPDARTWLSDLMSLSPLEED